MQEKNLQDKKKNKFSSRLKEMRLYTKSTGQSVFEGIWRTVLFILCMLWPLGILIWKLYGRVYFYF